MSLHFTAAERGEQLRRLLFDSRVTAVGLSTAATFPACHLHCGPTVGSPEICQTEPGSLGVLWYCGSRPQSQSSACLLPTNALYNLSCFRKVSN